MEKDAKQKSKKILHGISCFSISHSVAEGAVDEFGTNNKTTKPITNKMTKLKTPKAELPVICVITPTRNGPDTDANRPKIL